MIYTKSISELTWGDVEEFCRQKVGEGAYLDYKEDFPTHLYKTISAMANTFGGVILIGVEEDNDRTPKLPLMQKPEQGAQGNRSKPHTLTGARRTPKPG